MSNLALALATALLFSWSVRRDRRHLRLGVYLVATPWLLLAALTDLADALWPNASVGPLVRLAPLLVSVLVLAGFLVATGLMTTRSQGVSLRALRPALLGVALLALPGAGVLLARSHDGLLLALAAVAFVVSFYPGVAFVSFLAYAAMYARLPARSGPSAVVVLGTKLVNGVIPPLLEERLDKGMEQWHRQAALGFRPLLVPSGGAGAVAGAGGPAGTPGAHRSEGAAMAAYLVGHGIPVEQVVAETAARTTQQNLTLSRQVALSRGLEGHLTVVTSDYHVARTSLLARQAGLDADVVGSRTGREVLPRVFLHEFFTVLTFNPWVHAVLVPTALALGVVLARWF